MLTAALATVALMTGACGAITSGNGDAGASGTAAGASTFKLAPEIQERIDNGDKLTIKLAYHDPSLAFAKPIREGMEKAASEFGVDAALIGPTGGDAAKQVAELQTLITQKKVDGIAVSSASSDALKPVIKQAFDAGIPIISFNTDNPGSDQLAFVGQDLAASGESLGKKLVETAAGKTGKVVVFSLDTGAGWSNDRFGGFEKGIEGSGLTIVGPVNVGSEQSAAYNTVESTMKGQSDAVAVVGLDCCSTTAAAKWIEQSGNTGKILMGGFDLLPQTAEYIKSGVVNFTISQAPAEQGYQAVKVLYEFLKNGVQPENVDTGAEFITKENISTATVEG